MTVGIRLFCLTDDGHDLRMVGASHTIGGEFPCMVGVTAAVLLHADHVVYVLRQLGFSEQVQRL